MSRQWHPRGMLLQAPGGHSLLTAMRVARAVRQLTVLLARVHREVVVCAVRGSSRAGTGGASDIGRRLKNNVFSALVSDHEDESDEEEAEEEEAVHESVSAVEVPAKGGKRDKGGKRQPKQQRKVAAASVVAAKAPVAAVAATVAVAKVVLDAPVRLAA